MRKQGQKRSSAGFVGLAVFLGLLSLYATSLWISRGPIAFDPAILCRWDCGWYAKIIEHGYVSTLPPVPQDPDRANVAFFPMYPWIAGSFAKWVGLPVARALPAVASIMAAVFWWTFAGVCAENDERAARSARMIVSAAYPAAFFLVSGYSESTYCALLFLGIACLRSGSAFAPIGAFLGGAALGATRLTGFVIPGAVFGTWFVGRWITGERRFTGPGLRAGLWAIGAGVGAGAFLAYCQWKFGAWDLYFRTVETGWRKEASLTGFLRLFFYTLPKNVFPPWFARMPTRMSMMVNADLLIAFAYVIACAGRDLKEPGPGREERFARLGLLIGGGAHLFLTTLSDSGAEYRWGNGMRYSMPVFFLLVALWRTRWTPSAVRMRPTLLRFALGGLALFWIAYQLWYLTQFARGEWIS